jgi:hypothetical protein
MLDFYQKRKFRAVVNSRYTQIGLGLLIFMVGWSAFTRYQIAAEMSDRREVAEQSAAALEARRDELQEQVEYLSNERGIEAEMRRQFDVALEGEEVVVILEDETPAVDVSVASSTESEPVPWYRFWE